MSKGYVKFNDDGTVETLGTMAYEAVEDFAPNSVYEKVLGFAENVDGTAVATTALYTCPASRIAVPTKLILVANTVAGFTIVGIGDVGVGSADILPATTFTALNAAGKYLPTLIITPARLVVAADVVNLNITTAFTATTFSMAAILMGFEIPT